LRFEETIVAFQFASLVVRQNSAVFDFNRMRRCRPQAKCDTTSGMIDAMALLFGALLRLFRARRSLLLENLALRQQLAALKHRHARPRLAALDKVFWVLARKFWSGWKQALIVVSPETVVRWHRSGFALYWRAISKAHRVVGRRRISKEVRDLVFRMVAENPTWGAPRIHGELLMLGLDVSERTISRWIRRAPRDPESAKRWLVFLRNHREAIAAWTSSLSRPSRSVCSTASLSSITVGGISCISMSHDIPPVAGSFNSCGRLSPINRP
jgi:hypothetical protein